MDSAKQFWVQIGISLLTISASGVVSAWVTFNLNARKEHDAQRRQKLEALYEAVIQYYQLRTFWMLLWSKAMVGESAHDEALKAVIDETKDKPNYYSVAETLVAFYFPDLERQLQSLDEVSTEMTVIVIKYSSSVQAAGRDLNRSEAVEFYEPFRAKLHAFAKGGFDLKQAIVAHGRELKLLPKRKFAGWLRFPWSRG